MADQFCYRMKEARKERKYEPTGARRGFCQKISMILEEIALGQARKHRGEPSDST